MPIEDLDQEEYMDHFKTKTKLISFFNFHPYILLVDNEDTLSVFRILKEEFVNEAKVNLKMECKNLRVF